MSNLSKFIAAMLIVSLCILAGSAASPQLPCEFYGNVSLSGAPAPVGTIITAFVNDTERGSITVVTPGVYGGTGTFDERLIVMSGENDFANGVPQIAFKINGVLTAESAPFQPGTSSALDLGIGMPSNITAMAADNTPAPVNETIALS